MVACKRFPAVLAQYADGADCRMTPRFEITREVAVTARAPSGVSRRVLDDEVCGRLAAGQ
jgi:hypothetical protein